MNNSPCAFLGRVEEKIQQHFLGFCGLLTGTNFCRWGGAESKIISLSFTQKQKEKGKKRKISLWCVLV